MLVGSFQVDAFVYELIKILGGTRDAADDNNDDDNDDSHEHDEDARSYHDFIPFFPKSRMSHPVLDSVSSLRMVQRHLVFAIIKKKRPVKLAQNRSIRSAAGAE